MYKLIETKNPAKVKTFDTEAEAIAFVKRQKKAKDFYKLEKIEDVVSKTEAIKPHKVTWTVHKNSIDFTDAIEVTRDNVKSFYKKTGFIRVADMSGKTLHIGRTTNMGKMFSNYVNCARYNQSYDFNLSNGDKLFFKEADIKY